MSRKFERVLTFILGLWQILDGSITIIFYGIDNSIVQSKSGELINSEISLSSLSSIFGMTLICFGIINILVSKFQLKDGKETLKKVAWWFVFQSLFSYFILDIIGILCSIIATIFLLARNKAIKKNQLKSI